MGAPRPSVYVSGDTTPCRMAGVITSTRIDVRTARGGSLVLSVKSFSHTAHECLKRPSGALSPECMDPPRDLGASCVAWPARGTVCGTMRCMCGADAGCLAIDYQFLCSCAKIRLVRGCDAVHGLIRTGSNFNRLNRILGPPSNFNAISGDAKMMMPSTA